MTPWLIVGSIAAFIGSSIFFYIRGSKAGKNNERTKWLELTNEGREALAEELVQVNKRAKDREREVRASAGGPVDPAADVLDMSSFQTSSRGNSSSTGDSSTDQD